MASRVTADLLRDDGWDTAVAACSHVLHVASPLGASGSTRETIIESARGGTLRVLKAAMAAMCSSILSGASVRHRQAGLDPGAGQRPRSTWAICLRSMQCSSRTITTIISTATPSSRSGRRPLCSSCRSV